MCMCLCVCVCTCVVSTKARLYVCKTDVVYRTCAPNKRVEKRKNGYDNKPSNVAIATNIQYMDGFLSFSLSFSITHSLSISLSLIHSAVSFIHRFVCPMRKKAKISKGRAFCCFFCVCVYVLFCFGGVVFATLSPVPSLYIFYFCRKNQEKLNHSSNSGRFIEFTVKKFPSIRGEFLLFAQILHLNGGRVYLPTSNLAAAMLHTFYYQTWLHVNK